MRRARPTVAANSAIAKLAQTGNAFGNRGLKNQQLSTVEIFHYLPATGDTTFNFFENVGTAGFPFANITENKLQVGEGMTINQMFFSAFITTLGVPTLIGTFDSLGFDGLYLSQFNWFNDNNRVLKNKGLVDTFPAYNDKGWSAVNQVINLKTEITIQPLITYTCTLKTPAYVPPLEGTLFLGCHAKGTGTLLAPKKVY